MFNRKTKKYMKVLGAAAVLKRFPMLSLAAVAAGGAFAYYKLRGRSHRGDISGGSTSDDLSYSY